MQPRDGSGRILEDLAKMLSGTLEGQLEGNTLLAHRQDAVRCTRVKLTIAHTGLQTFTTPRAREHDSS